jgi:hypothetical protein
MKMKIDRFAHALNGVSAGRQCAHDLRGLAGLQLNDDLKRGKEECQKVQSFVTEK